MGKDNTIYWIRQVLSSVFDKSILKNGSTGSHKRLRIYTLHNSKKQ